MNKSTEVQTLSVLCIFGEQSEPTLSCQWADLCACKIKNHV